MFVQDAFMIQRMESVMKKGCIVRI
jgi:hypothetical protein